MNLGELIVELSADSSELEKTLERAKKKAYEAALLIENRFKGVDLTIGVDDKSMKKDDLGKHLNTKEKHLKQVNKYFNNNPITPSVDDSQLTDLNKHLNLKVQHLKQVNTYFDNNPITANVDTKSFDILEEKLNSVTDKIAYINDQIGNNPIKFEVDTSSIDAFEQRIKDLSAKNIKITAEAEKQAKKTRVTQESTPSQKQPSQSVNEKATGSKRISTKEITVEDFARAFLEELSSSAISSAIGSKKNSAGKSIPARATRVFLEGLSSGVIADISKGIGLAFADTFDSEKGGQPQNTTVTVDGTQNQATQASSEQKSKQRPTEERVLRKGLFTSVMDGIVGDFGISISKGINNSLIDTFGSDITTTTRIATNSLLRLFGLGKKAQEDANKTVGEKAVSVGQDAFSAFRRLYDQRAIGMDRIGNFNKNSSTTQATNTQATNTQATNTQATNTQATNTQATNTQATNTQTPDNDNFLINTINKANTTIKQHIQNAVVQSINNTIDNTVNAASGQIGNVIGGTLNAVGVPGVVSGFVGHIAAGQIASVGKQSAKPVLKTILPNTYDVVSELLGKKKTAQSDPAAPNSKQEETKSDEAAIKLENAAIKLENAAEILNNAVNALANFAANTNPVTPIQSPLNVPLNVPQKVKKKVTEDDFELIPVSIPEPVKKQIQFIKSGIVKGVDLSEQYKNATESQNNLTPLQPAQAVQVNKIKQQSEVSLNTIKQALDGINEYFKTEYGKLITEVDEAVNYGTLEDFKNTKAKLDKFIKSSNDALATVDKYIQTGKDAGYESTFGSELTKIHAAGKSNISANISGAKIKKGRLNREETEISNLQRKKFIKEADKLGIAYDEKLKKPIKATPEGVPAEIRKSLDDLMAQVQVKQFDQQRIEYVAKAEKLGIDIDAGLAKGVKHGSDGVSDEARKMLDDLIEAVEKKMKIQSPSWIMFEIGMMIASGLFFGMQKGNSKVSEGARKMVTTVKSAFDPLNDLSSLGLAGTYMIPNLSDISNKAMIAMSATSTGLNMLDKVGEHHAANPDQTLFQATYGTAKNFVKDAVTDKTFTQPREAVDHLVNIAKFGTELVTPLGLKAFTNPIGSANDGVAAAFRTMAIAKSLKQAHQDTKQQTQQDSTLNYASTFKNVLPQYLKANKIGRAEALKMFGGVLKVVPDMHGSNDANLSNAGALVTGTAASLGNAAISKFAPVANFVETGKDVVKGLEQGILKNAGIATNAIAGLGDSIQSQIKQKMGISSPSKVMIALGLMIASGLAIGIKKGVIDVSDASEMLAGAVDIGTKELNLFNSEHISNYDDVIKNSVGNMADVTKNVYDKSNQKEKRSLFGSMIGAAMVALGDTGILGKISEPVKHLGAYYQGNIDVHKIQGRTAREAEMAVMYRSMLEYKFKAMQENKPSATIPDQWEMNDGTVGNNISQIPGFKNLHYTLGGFNYNRNKEGGLQINDVYDWSHDTNLMTGFNTPFKLATKINKMLMNHPKIAQSLGLTYLDAYQGYGKLNDKNELLFAFNNSDPNLKELALGDYIHAGLGGKPYIQSHTVSPEKLQELQAKAARAFNNSGGDYKQFAQQPEVQEYLKEVDKPAHPLTKLLSAIKKDFGGDSILGNVFNSAMSAFGKGGGLKDIGVNFISSFSKGVFSSGGTMMRTLGSFINNAINIFSKGGNLKDIGVNFISAFGRGVFSSAGSVIGLLTNFGSSAIDAIKQVFGIASPSKVMMAIGTIFGNSFGTKALESLKTAKAAIFKVMLGIVANIKNAVSSAGNEIYNNSKILKGINAIGGATSNLSNQIYNNSKIVRGVSTFNNNAKSFLSSLPPPTPVYMQVNPLNNVGFLPKVKQTFAQEFNNSELPKVFGDIQFFLNLFRRSPQANKSQQSPQQVSPPAVLHSISPFLQLTGKTTSLPTPQSLAKTTLLPTPQSLNKTILPLINTFLQPLITTLQSSFTKIQPLITTLQSPFTKIQPSITTLQSPFTKIQPSITTLQSPFTKIQPSITTLQSPFTKIQPSITTLSPTTLQTQIYPNLPQPPTTLQTQIYPNLPQPPTTLQTQIYPDPPNPLPPLPPNPNPPNPLPPLPPNPNPPNPLPPLPPNPNPPNPNPPNPLPPLPPTIPTLITDLVANVFGAINDSIRGGGYASLGQRMRNAVNAGLFSIADTLRQPLHQKLLSQTRDVLPWFLKFIPSILLLLPKLKIAAPLIGGLALALGNSIAKNLLENNLIKEGGFLTRILSSITNINLPATPGHKSGNVLSALHDAATPVPHFMGINPLLSIGLGVASPLYNSYSGILGLDKSLDPKQKAPTIKKILQDQTETNREQIGLKDNTKGFEATKDFLDNVTKNILNGVLDKVNLPLIPTSVLQALIGRKISQRLDGTTKSIYALGAERSKAEQLLEKTIQSGRTGVELRTDILTRQALRERGVSKTVRDAMTPDQLAAAREKILGTPIDLTPNERKLLQAMGDTELLQKQLGTKKAERRLDALTANVLKERGLDSSARRQIKQDQSGYGFSDFRQKLANDPRTGSFIGRFTEAYATNDQDAIKGLIKEGLTRAGMSAKKIDSIDPNLLDTATAGLMATLTGLQSKFKEKGFDMGKALAKGFKDSMVNLANTKDDLEYNAKKAIGQAGFGDSIKVIIGRLSRGHVATQSHFQEMYNNMGAGVKKAMFGGSKEGDEMFPNVLQFFGSIATTLAPITTMIGAITPLLLPLAPIITGIGMAVNMVAPHVAKLIDGIQRVEVLQRRFQFLGGSKEGGIAEFKYAKDIANKLNVPSEVAANSYSQLAIAAKDSKMEGQGVKELFEGITSSLSALGINGQDASLVFMAYTQILAKGKLSMEELRQQLGEKFPPAMAVFAKAMGVSVPEMNALVASGSVLSQDILPKVAKVLKEDYGNAAANQAGGLVVALNKLGNVGFEAVSIFTDKVGGLLSAPVDFFATVAGLLVGSLNQLLPLAQSFMIGFAATISIGLTIILSKFKPFLVAIGTLQSFLLATFSTITTNMMPMIVGVTADVADGWLGAEKDLIQNMMDGFTNLIVSTFSTIDSIMRSASNNTVSFTSVFGNLIQGAEQAGSAMDGLKNIFASVFKILPSGILEILAILFMIEQGSGLATMALGPAIVSFGKGAIGMLQGVRVAFFSFMRSAALAVELLLTSMSQASAATDLLGVKTKVNIAILNGALVLLQALLSKLVIVYAIIMFSKGDFSDPLRESMNKTTADVNKQLTDVRSNINKTTEAFNNATKSVAKLGNTITNALPAKGVQLDVRSLWGGGDYKWDDAVRDTNAKYREGGSGPSAMDVIGTGALYAGGAGYAVAAGSKAIKAITDLAVKTAPIIQQNKALVAQGIQATSITRVTLFGRLATAIAPVVAIMGPWGLAIAGIIAAIGLATVALNTFAPQLTKKQLDFIEGKTDAKGNAITDGSGLKLTNTINAKKVGERLDHSSQQALKAAVDDQLNTERLKEFLNTYGLTGKVDHYIAPPLAKMTDIQENDFKSDPSTVKIDKEIANVKASLQRIEQEAEDNTPAAISRQRAMPKYTDTKKQLTELEKNRNLMQYAYMANANNKSDMDEIDNKIKDKEKEFKIAEAAYDKKRRKKSDLDFSSSWDSEEYKILIKNKKELEKLQKDKAQLQTNINATAKRRVNFNAIEKFNKQLEKAVSDYVNVDQQLKTKPSDALRAQAGKLKEEVKRLQKEIEREKSEFSSPLAGLRNSLKLKQDEATNIAADMSPEMTPEIRASRLANNKKQQELLKKSISVVEKFEPPDLSQTLYTKASTALADAETKLDVNLSKNKIVSNQAQTKLYGTTLTSQQIAPDLSARQIADLNFQQKELQSSIKTKQQSLKELRMAEGLNVSNIADIQEKIQKLEQDLRKDREQVSQNTLEIVKAQREARQALIDQTKQVAEYYRTSLRESQAAAIEFDKATNNIKSQQFATKLKQALVGAGNNIFTNFIDSVIGLFQQLTEIENLRLDRQKQKLDYENNIQDILIKVTEMQRSLPGKIVPFSLDQIRNFDKELGTVNSSVSGINKEINSVTKNLGVSAVNSTIQLNKQLKEVLSTVEKINKVTSNQQLQPPNGSGNIQPQDFQTLDNLNIPQSSLPTPTPVATNTLKEVLVAGIDSDIPVQLYANKPKNKDNSFNLTPFTGSAANPFLLPSTFVSPIANRSLADLLNTKYGHQELFGYRNSKALTLGRNAGVNRQSSVVASLGGTAFLEGNALKIAHKAADGKIVYVVYQGLDPKSITKNLRIKGKEKVEVSSGQIIGNPSSDKFKFSIAVGEPGKVTQNPYKNPLTFVRDIYRANQRQPINPLQWINRNLINRTDPVVNSLGLTPYTGVIKTSNAPTIKPNVRSQNDISNNDISNWALQIERQAKVRLEPAATKVVTELNRRLPKRKNNQGTGKQQTRTNQGTGITEADLMSVVPQNTIGKATPVNYKTGVKPTNASTGSNAGGNSQSKKKDNLLVSPIRNKTFDAIVNANDEDVLSGLDPKTILQAPVSGKATARFGLYANPKITDLTIERTIGNKTLTFRFNRVDVDSIKKYLPTLKKEGDSVNVKAGDAIGQPSVKNPYLEIEIDGKEVDNLRFFKDVQRVKEDLNIFQRVLRKLVDPLDPNITTLGLNRVDQIPVTTQQPGKTPGTGKTPQIPVTPSTGAGQTPGPGKTPQIPQLPQIPQTRQPVVIPPGTDPYTRSQLQNQPLNPDKLQGGVGEAGKLGVEAAKKRDAAARLQRQQEISAKLVEFQRNLSNLLRDTNKGIRDESLQAAQDINNASEYIQGLLNPNASDKEKFATDFQKLKNEYQARINEQQNIIESTRAPLAELAKVDELIAAAQREGIDASGLKRLRDEVYRVVKARERTAIALRNMYTKNKQAVFDKYVSRFKEEQSDKDADRKAALLGVNISQLKLRLEELRGIQAIDPLNPELLKIPDLEANIAELELTQTTLQKIAALRREWRQSGGKNMGKDVYDKRMQDIKNTVTKQTAIIERKRRTDNILAYVNRELGLIDKGAAEREPITKGLQLDNSLFAARNKNGLVNIINFENEALIKQKDLMDSYRKTSLETQRDFKLSSDDRITKRLRNAMNLQKELNVLKIETEYQKATGEIKNRQVTVDVEVRLSDSAKAIFESKSSIKKNLGLELAGERLDRQNAITTQENEYKRKQNETSQFILDNNLTESQAYVLRKNNEVENDLKLRTIKSQFSEFAQLIKSFVSGFKSSFKEFLLSTEDTGTALLNLAKGIGKSVLDTLAEIASKRITDLLFGWMGGAGLNPATELSFAAQQLTQAAIALQTAAGASALDLGSFDGFAGFGDIASFIPTGMEFLDPSTFGAADFGSAILSGFAKGGMIDKDTLGKIQNFANGGIVGTMNKERAMTGRTPHLVIASEGERILNHKETAIWNRLQSGISGFADGGIVGGGSGDIASKIGSTTTVNVPVSVSVSEGSDVDGARLSQTVQALVSDGIRREMRPGGSIRRGNPYGR